MFNGVKLTGDVVKITKSGLLMATVNESANGTQYTEQISIALTKKDQPDWLKEGSKISLKGQLVTKNNIQAVQAMPESVTEADEDAEYMNLARIVAKVAYPFQYWSKSEGKQPFGNLAVRAAKSIFRGVLFGALATTFSRRVKRGMQVQLQGFLRNRKFVDSQGVQRSALEIIADPDWTEIMSAAEDQDEFADFMPAEDETQPAKANSPAF